MDEKEAELYRAGALLVALADMEGGQAETEALGEFEREAAEELLQLLEATLPGVKQVVDDAERVVRARARVKLSKIEGVSTVIKSAFELAEGNLERARQDFRADLDRDAIAGLKAWARLKIISLGGTLTEN